MLHFFSDSVNVYHLPLIQFKLERKWPLVGHFELCDIGYTDRLGVFWIKVLVLKKVKALSVQGEPFSLPARKSRVKARFKARVKARVKAVRIFLLGNRTFPIDDNPNSNRDLMTVTCSQV